MTNKKSGKPVEGRVIEALPATSFKVQLKNNEEILVYLSGRMRLHHIKVLPGDIVLMELSPDGKRGRIIRRL